MTNEASDEAFEMSDATNEASDGAFEVSVATNEAWEMRAYTPKIIKNEAFTLFFDGNRKAMLRVRPKQTRLVRELAWGKIGCRRVKHRRNPAS